MTVSLSQQRAQHLLVRTDEVLSEGELLACTWACQGSQCLGPMEMAVGFPRGGPEEWQSFSWSKYECLQTIDQCGQNPPTLTFSLKAIAARDCSPTETSFWDWLTCAAASAHRKLTAALECGPRRREQSPPSPSFPKRATVVSFVSAISSLLQDPALSDAVRPGPCL